jgi:hypothetical protein
MAINRGKRISELTPLTSASLDTTIVGVDNGTTYKIELDTLADAVTSRVNTLDRERLQSLESVTSSFETKGRSVISGSSQLTSSFDTRYVLSGSITQTTWDNIANKPAGIVSQSTDLSSLNNFTASISTASLVNRLNVIESVSGSWITESETGSFLTNLNGAISSSSQLTSSFDTRYTLSGSVQPLPSGLISGSSQVLGGSGIYSSSAQLPAGTISGSSQLTASYDTRYTLSGSVVSGTTPMGTISGSAQISAFGFVSGSYVTTSSFNSFTASAQSVTTGSNSFNGTQIITGSLIITTGSFIGSQILANTSSLYLTSGSNLYVQNNGLVEITGSVIATSISGSIASTNGVISGSSQLTSSYDTRYILSGSLTAGSNVSVSDTASASPSEGDLWWKSDDGNLYVYYDSYWVVATDTISAIPNGVISGSAQITTLGFVSGSYETTGRGIISGSAQ